MKSLLLSKAGATYYYGGHFTVAIRKQLVEFYMRLEGGWHGVANFEIYKKFVRIIISLGGDFSKDLFEKVLINGINPEKYPKLAELISPESPYIIVNDKTGDKPETHFVQDIEIDFKSYLEVFGNIKIIETAGNAIKYFVDLHNELFNSTDPDIKSLTDCFYD